MNNIFEELLSHEDKCSQEELIEFMKHFDSVQDKLKVFHIVGTNGKGSTSHYIEQMLMAKKMKVVKYTSPHLIELNERITMDWVNIDTDTLVRLYNSICEGMEKTKIRLSFLQILTCIAFIWAYENKVDYLVLEAGLGARLDSTNIVKKPEAVVITRIGLDHQEILGKTLQEITTEKCAAIKKGVDTYMLSQDDAVEQVIVDRTHIALANLIRVEPYEIINHNPTRFEHAGMDIIPMNAGAYQASNLALAAAVTKVVPELVKAVAETTCWRGRMQRIEGTNIVVDGAHNIDGIRAFVETAMEYDKIKVVYSGLAKKNNKRHLELISALDAELVVTKFDSPIVMDLSDFKDDYTVNDDIDALIKEAKESDVTTFFVGSLHFIGEVLKRV